MGWSVNIHLGWCSRIDWRWFLSGLKQKPPTTKFLLPSRVWLIDGSGSTNSWPNSGRADSNSHKICGSNLLPGFWDPDFWKLTMVIWLSMSKTLALWNLQKYEHQFMAAERYGWSIATQSPESMSRRIIQTFVDQSLDCSGWPRSQKLVATGTTSFGW